MVVHISHFPPIFLDTIRVGPGLVPIYSLSQRTYVLISFKSKHWEMLVNSAKAKRCVRFYRATETQRFRLNTFVIEEGRRYHRCLGSVLVRNRLSKFIFSVTYEQSCNTEVRSSSEQQAKNVNTDTQRMSKKPILSCNSDGESSRPGRTERVGEVQRPLAKLVKFTDVRTCFLPFTNLLNPN